jgi:hypothetical protein
MTPSNSDEEMNQKIMSLSKEGREKWIKAIRKAERDETMVKSESPDRAQTPPPLQSKRALNSPFTPFNGGERKVFLFNIIF